MKNWRLPRAPELVLFDLDGTLSDSADGIVASMRNAFSAEGVEPPSESVLRSFVGPPFATALAALGCEPPVIDRLVAAYRADYNAGRLFESKIFPGVEQALRDLDERGVALAVATSKPQPTARRIVEHFGVERYLVHGLDSVCGSDPDVPGESKADVIARALAAHDERVGHGRSEPATRYRAPQSAADVSLHADRPTVDSFDVEKALLSGFSRPAVMVGDRLHDVEGARAHGLDCVGVSWGYAAEGELRQAGAVAVVETPSALVELLMRPA